MTSPPNETLPAHVSDVRISSPTTSEVITIPGNTSVEITEDDRNDNYVGVRKSKIKRMRDLIERLPDSAFSWRDIFITIGSLAVGTIITSALTGIPLNGYKGFLIYVVGTALFVGCTVGVVAQWKINSERIESIKKDLYDLMPPDIS